MPQSETQPHRGRWAPHPAIGVTIQSATLRHCNRLLGAAALGKSKDGAPKIAKLVYKWFNNGLW